MRNHKRSGFTLAEILVALAIFALGGTAIMALFITNVRLSRQAMDYTRASEITRNVRSLMTQSLARPVDLGTDEYIYAFYYPESSLSFRPDEYRNTYETDADSRPDVPEQLGGTPGSNVVFYKLPTQMYDAGAGDASPNMVTVMPRDALTNTGGVMTFPDGPPQVFRLLPDPLRRAQALDGMDPDDRMFYQFDYSIRRSVLRASVDAADGKGGKEPLQDLFVIHVKVFKSFEFGDVINDPIFEWDFYVNATR
jgi:prepilin-type N-terminal cleavage/methylation domain-containing protein